MDLSDVTDVLLNRGVQVEKSIRHKAISFLLVAEKNNDRPKLIFCCICGEHFPKP